MLVRDGKAKDDTINIRLVNAFQQNLQKVKDWAPKQGNIDILFVSHRNLIDNPTEELAKVSTFLGGNLNIQEMASVVDKSLHREKSNK